MYIIASSTISHQPTFRNKGFAKQLCELKDPSVVLHPDYSAFIPVMERRRMSDVLKMAITCSIDCLQQAELQQPGAIIVGTSMGSCTHTKNFLDKIISADGSLISPTSFITSTHNTIAGQISLLLKNHSYNTTHTQNSLSFEQALTDGMLCLNEGCQNVLIGAADEVEKELFNMEARLRTEDLHITSGASFFILTSEKTYNSLATLLNVASFSLVNDISASITDFLKTNNLSESEIDLILFSGSSPNTIMQLQKLFDVKKLFDYQKLSGVSFTNSAFAMSYAVDTLSDDSCKNVRTILVCNNLVPENLGLMLLKKYKHEVD
ncbi:MAG: beta-ketoacyl synthase chain length factor [Chitinophagaceae bacterium]|nr:beta-ketoacyl synthase chain length factor [Chitinophagaceae bacterium]